MATNIDKELLMLQAKNAARRAAELLEANATGAARAELLKAVELIERVHKLAA
jgi:hypothetical protein